MKVKITQKGVYDDKGKRIEVGKVLTVKGDEIPGYLVNKCSVVEGSTAKEAVVNPAKAEGEKAEGGAA